MKKYLLVLLCGMGFAGLAKASDSIEMDLGDLYNSTGTQYVPVGGLLQLIASPVSLATPDGLFLPPTASSFVTGSDILVESFSMNYNFAVGEADELANFAINTGSTPIAPGDALLLRWYPTLTTASTAPGLGATYGQYRSDTAESDEAGISWFVPATDGVTLTFPGGLDFQTMAAGGSNPEIAGYASDIVVLAPEPSPLAALAFGLFGMASLWLARPFFNRGQTKSA